MTVVIENEKSIELAEIEHIKVFVLFMLLFMIFMPNHFWYVHAMIDYPNLESHRINNESSSANY